MPRQKTFNKQEVLQDAVELFWKKGFNQTSIQDLVDNLGVNRASLYDTYLDKEGLYTESFYLYREKTSQQISYIFSKEKTIKTGFKQFAKYFIFELLSNKKGCLISNSYAELLPSKSKKIEKILDETRVIWLEIIQKLLKKANKQNELKKDINIIKHSYFIYSILLGTAILSKTNIETKKLKISLDIINTITPYIENKFMPTARPKSSI